MSLLSISRLETPLQVGKNTLVRTYILLPSICIWSIFIYLSVSKTERWSRSLPSYFHKAVSDLFLRFLVVSFVWFQQSKYEKYERLRWHSDTTGIAYGCHEYSPPSNLQDYDWATQTKTITELSKQRFKRMTEWSFLQSTAA